MGCDEWVQLQKEDHSERYNSGHSRNSILGQNMRISLRAAKWWHKQGILSINIRADRVAKHHSTFAADREVVTGSRGGQASRSV